MHENILTQEQIDLLPFIQKFRGDYGLVGGTAIALHIGHRESIDFDLFTFEPFNNVKIKRVFRTEHVQISRVFRDEIGQLTIVTASGVQITFFHYPHTVPFTEKYENVITLPDLLTLAAMKAYALGNRGKWKDYVDLYFILRDHHTMEEISEKAENLFGNEFNQKLFREQLGYFEDINYREKVVYKEGYAVDDETVKKALVEHSLF